jgi:hypothetical protein
VAVGLDLIQAVIAQLESNSAVTGLFLDTWNQYGQIGVAKFFTDVVDQVPVPYCLIEEVGETYEFMTQSGVPGELSHPFMSPGKMSFRIFAPTRILTRQLGYAVAICLNDAQLAWPSQGDTMLFRMSQSVFVPMTEPSGPGVAILFCRRFIFDYEYSASLEIYS